MNRVIPTVNWRVCWPCKEYFKTAKGYANHPCKGKLKKGQSKQELKENRSSEEISAIKSNVTEEAKHSKETTAAAHEESKEKQPAKPVFTESQYESEGAKTENATTSTVKKTYLLFQILPETAPGPSHTDLKSSLINSSAQGTIKNPKLDTTALKSETWKSRYGNSINKKHAKVNYQRHQPGGNYIRQGNPKRSPSQGNAKTGINNSQPNVDRPYACDMCDKRFLQKHHLRRHRRIHTGEKPFVCEFCGKAFSRKEDLIPHRRIHTGELPFFCSKCKKKFRHKRCWMAHDAMHHPEKHFGCQTCGKKFPRKAALTEHEKRHVGKSAEIVMIS